MNDYRKLNKERLFALLKEYEPIIKEVKLGRSSFIFYCSNRKT